jgi:predicted Rossmann fold flavoprotein
MCAIETAKRGRKVLILDHANKPGKKILMSGGGRCNFTNYHISPKNYTSHNPHFCKSALSRYTQWDFIDLVKKYNIPFHEKKHGQLFCTNKSKDILDMLLSECEKTGVLINLNESIEFVKSIDSPDKIEKTEKTEKTEKFYHKTINPRFKIKTNQAEYLCESLVIATGGLSVPTMGASPLGYKIAAQFNIPVYPTRAGLVPLTLQPEDKEQFSILSGISVESNLSVNTAEKTNFTENILFTHRGLSGPAILQISNYWQPGNELRIKLLPDINLLEILKSAQRQCPNQTLQETLGNYIPKRVISIFIETKINTTITNKTLQNLSHDDFSSISNQFQAWSIKPNGTEGYRTAEVTLGGVDCNAISSKTMETHKTPGLYFIGEVLDVTGWLGGYNFQWAWSSGWAAGQVV